MFHKISAMNMTYSYHVFMVSFNVARSVTGRFNRAGQYVRHTRQFVAKAQKITTRSFQRNRMR